MQFLSDDETQNWLRQRLDGAADAKSVEACLPAFAKFRVPVDSNVKTVIAREVVEHFASDRPGLLWVTAWGIFSSAEDLALMRRFRGSLGEHRRIGAAPGHVWNYLELADVQSLLALVMYFYWDALLIDGRAGLALRVSHDEWLSVHAIDSERLDPLQQVLRYLKLTELHPR